MWLVECWSRWGCVYVWLKFNPEKPGYLANEIEDKRERRETFHGIVFVPELHI